MESSQSGLRYACWNAAISYHSPIEVRRETARRAGNPDQEAVPCRTLNLNNGSRR